MKSSTPFYAMICIVVMIVAAVVLLLFSNPATAPSLTIVIGLIVTSIPSLVAAFHAERASRDIRNGVVVEKVKQGATQAIEESQVLTRTGPVATASLTALTRLLETNTAATLLNTQLQQAKNVE